MRLGIFLKFVLLFAFMALLLGTAGLFAYKNYRQGYSEVDGRRQNAPLFDQPRRSRSHQQVRQPKRDLWEPDQQYQDDNIAQDERHASSVDILER